jgi:hypothetical protein
MEFIASFMKTDEWVQMVKDEGNSQACHTL